VTECSPSNYEALGSIPSTEEKRKLRILFGCDMFISTSSFAQQIIRQCLTLCREIYSAHRDALQAQVGMQKSSTGQGGMKKCDTARYVTAFPLGYSHCTQDSTHLPLVQEAHRPSPDKGQGSEGGTSRLTLHCITQSCIIITAIK
jgi:hypothetical protein